MPVAKYKERTNLPISIFLKTRKDFFAMRKDPERLHTARWLKVHALQNEISHWRYALEYDSKIKSEGLKGIAEAEEYYLKLLKIAILKHNTYFKKTDSWPCPELHFMDKGLFLFGDKEPILRKKP